MNPAMIAAFAARFGPWFGRMVAASPSLLAKVANKLRASDKAAVIGNTVADVVKYAKTNPVTSVLTLTTLASLGMSVVDLLGGDDEVAKLASKVDPETAAFLGSLANRERSMSSSQLVFDQTVAVGDLSAHLSTGLAANKAANEVAIEVLSFAKRFFGSPLAALEGHRLLQAFMEMPHADVTEGYSSLKLR